MINFDSSCYITACWARKYEVKGLKIQKGISKNLNTVGSKSNHRGKSGSCRNNEVKVRKSSYRKKY